MKYNLKDFEIVTVNRELDHHWFDNTGCQYPLVCPKGTKVKFKGLLRNYYGNWFEVEYGGRLCYGFPSDFDGNVMLEHEHKTQFHAPSCKWIHIHIYTDRYKNRYRLLNEEGDLELL